MKPTALGNTLPYWRELLAPQGAVCLCPCLAWGQGNKNGSVDRGDRWVLTESLSLVLWVIHSQGRGWQEGGPRQGRREGLACLLCCVVYKKSHKRGTSVAQLEKHVALDLGVLSSNGMFGIEILTYIYTYVNLKST